MRGIVVVMLRALLAAAVCVLVMPAVARAAGVAPDARTARAGLAAAVKEGAISEAAAARYRATLRRAVNLVDRLPSRRARALQAVVEEVAGQAERYRAPRALTLFSMLAFNADYLGSQAVPRDGRGRTGRGRLPLLRGPWPSVPSARKRRAAQSPSLPRPER